MNNQDALKFWKHKSNDNPNELTIKVNPINDFTKIDADFILRYANSNSDVLDLASGTGLTVNKYYDKVSTVTAVELFPSFSKFIIKDTRIEVVNADISEYNTHKKFDIITMFGIVSYFNREEIHSIYAKYRNYLNENGVLLIKNQFGIVKDVSVNGYSEELKTEYYSEYRTLHSEIDILKDIGFKEISYVDIYPPEANRWDNTHFYAIVAKK